MKINLPEVVKEVSAAFERYEKALNENDVAVLDELFLDSPQVVRYGTAEQLYGSAEVRAFRAARPAKDLRRELTRVAIVTFGADYAVASCEYRRLESGRRGRQQQTWLRTPQGWRIVAAHVSLLD
jgi:hypothetical protein